MILYLCWKVVIPVHVHMYMQVTIILFLLVLVLSDLPLPSHLPTPIERTVLGGTGLSDGAKKVLNKSNPMLTAQVTQALLSVDCNFL